MTGFQLNVGTTSDAVGLLIAGQVGRRPRLVVDPRRRPGLLPAVVVDGAHLPVEIVGRVRLVEAGVRRVRGGDVLDRPARPEVGVGRDHQLVLTGAVDRIPREGGHSADGRAVRRRHQGRAHLRAVERLRMPAVGRGGRAGPVGAGRGQHHPPVVRALVLVRASRGARTRRVRRNVREPVVDDRVERRVARHDHEVAVGAGNRVPGEQRHRPGGAAGDRAVVVGSAQVAGGAGSGARVPGRQAGELECRAPCRRRWDRGTWDRRRRRRCRSRRCWRCHGTG